MSLGRHTNVEVTSLSSGVIGVGDFSVLRLTATLSVTADVSAVPGQCDLCGCETPDPGEDAIWYLLENHDGGRLCFAGPESVLEKKERDCYPVMGWGLSNGKLTCGPCQKKIDGAIDELRRRVSQTGEASGA